MLEEDLEVEVTSESGLQAADEVDEVDEVAPPERARDLRAQWTERLMLVTGAIAEAVTTEQVFQAVVGQTAAALGAASAGLWLVRDDDEVARLCHAGGYSEAGVPATAALSLEGPASFPIADAIRSGQLVWIGSHAELAARYPDVSRLPAPASSYAVV